MTATPHPELEDLLLWQSGELGENQANEIATHLAACPACQAELSGMESLKEKVVRVNTSAAARSFRTAFETKQMPRWRRYAIRFLSPRTAMSVTASILIVALVLFSVTELTPEARADTLLQHAIKQQANASSTPQLLRVDATRLQCRFPIRETSAETLTVANRNQPECKLIADRFEAAGWTRSELLSAKVFQHWRKALHHKRDFIRQINDATEVTTTTEEGSIRSATLRLRPSDDHPVFGRFEFASGPSPVSVEVTEAIMDTPNAPNTTPVAITDSTHKSVLSEHVIDPLDVAEAQVRLALHQTGADRNVLLAVERETTHIRVWGVVPTNAIRQQISNAINGLPNVRDEVLGVIGDQSSQSPSPWQAYRGDGPPLGFDAIQALYASDMGGRQQFLNDLDNQTRELVAEARSRDALLALASRIQPEDAVRAAQLKHAASELELEMMGDMASLRDRLRPLAETGHGHPQHPLSSAQAMHLYLLVHEVLFQAKSSDSLDLNTALGQIRGLIGG